MTASNSQPLPPIIHAIGGAIGSALAILTFYPLERIRVELQAQGVNGNHSVGTAGNENIVSDASRSADNESDVNGNRDNTHPNVEDGGMRENERIIVEESNETSESTAESRPPRHSLPIQQQNHDSSPDSSTEGSFELVSAPASMDADSIESISSGEGHVECVNGPDIAAGFVGGEETHSSQEGIVPADDVRPDANNNNNNNENGFVQDNNLNASSDEQTEQNIQTIITYNAIRSESIMECFLRLHKEQTLYKGASHMVTTLTVSNFIFFYALQVTKRSLSSMPRSKMSVSLLASSIAGAINVLLTNPLWVASLRIMESKVPPDKNYKACNQQQKRQQSISLWKVMNHIARKEGILHLWNGMFVSLLLVSNPAIQHFLYGQLRSWLIDMRNTESSGRRRRNSVAVTTLTPLEAFVFGALAKTGATVVTYPLQLAQVLLRLQSKAKKATPTQSTKNSTDIDDSTADKNEKNYTGTIDCLYQQFLRGGMPALFQGMNAKLIQTVLTAAFTFLTYEQTLTLVGMIYQRLRKRHNTIAAR